MRISDRIFGAVVILSSGVYVMAARGIQKPFFADPLGPQAFPIGVGIVAAICGLVMVFSPDEEPEWPEMRSFLALVGSTALLVAYAYALKPLGFLVPTLIASAVIAWQITPQPLRSVVYGIGISLVLFILFKHFLNLSLKGFGPWVETYAPPLLYLEVAIDWVVGHFKSAVLSVVSFIAGLFASAPAS